MARSKAFMYMLVSIIAITLGCYLLVYVWEITDQNQFLSVLAIILIVGGSGAFSIALTRIIVPGVIFSIGDLSSRSAYDLFSQRVGRKTARKVNWISFALLILTLLIVAYLFSLLMKKYNLS